ncbi:MAG: hypothetical protein ACYTGH_14875 [Planctomycetota bacterium]|jgi:hypothetical protein
MNHPPRTNPFRTECLDRLTYRMGESGLAALVEAFFAQGCRGAIVAPHGHGKSTLVRALMPHLATAGLTCHHHYLTRESRRLPRHWTHSFLTRLTAKDLLILDGAEQLTWTAWQRLRWQTRRTGLLITTHRPNRLPTLYRCRTDPALAYALIDHLLPDHNPLTPNEVKALFTAHQGNLRDLFFALYDRFGR